MLARRVADIDADYVGGDNESGAQAATSHLIVEHNCTRLAFLGGFADSSARQERLAGFRRSAAEHGLVIAASNTPTCAPDRLQARAAARKLLSGTDVPDGLLCFNDVVALCVLDILNETGLKPGVDVRVIGFDDVEAAASARPSLASVSVPAHTAGRQAAEMLLARVRGDRVEAEELVLAVELKPRETCGCTETEES
jgi:LacI family transcriptional regulator